MLLMNWKSLWSVCLATLATVMALPLAGLADEPPADAKPFKLATPGLSVRINPSRAYTVDSIWLKDHLLGQPNGNYGFVYHAGEAKFIGSGHREGGQEQVDDVQLLVDGKPVAPPYPAQIRGERFEFIKRSRLNTILLTTRYQLDSDRLIESHEVEAAQPTFIMTSYAFMYPWSSTTTQWLARTLDGQMLEGSFDNEGWELKADVRWLALWEPKSQAVILTEFPPDLPRGQGIRHAIWDLKAYHKQYYQPWSNITLEPGVKHSFRVSVRAFHAEPEQWKDRAQAEAYEYEGGYQPQSESASQTQAKASAMQQAVEALYPPLDPSQTPAWLAEPVAMEALDPDTVLAPWQPVEASENEVKVWGRSYQLGDWALPRQVVAMGEPLLAEPARLELQLANQADPLRPAQVNLAARHKGQVRYTAQAQQGEVTALMEGLYEYDGFSRFDLHLKGPEPVQVQRLSLVIPLREPEARFLQHASAWNLTMSQQLTAVSQAVPDGQGEVYRYGFSPFLWLGGYDRGLAWYAESDEHWYPFKNSSAIRLVRHKGRVELHIDLIAQPTTLPAQSTFTFGLMATPVKPLPQGWRSWRITTQNPAQRAEQHDQIGNQVIYWYDRWRIVHHYPRPRDPAAFRADVEKLHAGGAHRVYPYLDVTLMSSGDQTTIPGESFHFLPPEWPRYGQAWMIQPNYRTTAYKRVSPASSWADFALWCVRSWIVDGGATGIYLDESFPYADTAAEHGMGYTDPQGVRQPTYAIFATRNFYKRLAYLFQQYAKGSPALMAHTSATIAVPYLSFADIQLTGEQYYHSMRKWEGDGYASYIKMAPLEDFHAEHRGAQFGLVPVILPLYKPPFSTKWPETKTTEAPMRELQALTLLHDVLVWPNFGNPQPALRAQKIKADFGIAADDVEFFPYWKSDPHRLVASADAGIKVTYYRRSGRLLVIVANLGDAPASAELHAESVLDGKPARLAVDAESGEPLPIDGTRIKITVPRRDYRILRIGS